MRKNKNHTFKQNNITDKYYQDKKNDASYTTKVCPSIQNIYIYIYIHTIIVSIIKTSTKLKVSILSEAWAWELGQPLQGGSLSPYP